MEQYEINDETLAIIPIGEDYSQVYELNQDLNVYQNANKIMEESCLYFGSSLDGRKKGTENMIGINYKAPVIVEETKEIIFFPLSSSRYNNAIWIGLKNLRKYYKREDEIVLEFVNGKKIFLKSSYGVFNNQVLRATRLESALRGRKTSKNRFN